MSLVERIEQRLIEALSPERLALENESRHHNVPEGSESHWNAIIVSDAFAGKSRIQRQRLVYETLDREFADGIHAFTMKTLTPSEWEQAGGDVANPAPRCLGGGR